MNTSARILVAGLAAILTFAPPLVSAQSNASPATGTCVVLTVEGNVEVASSGTTTWSIVTPNQVLRVGDRVRTGLRSRATLKWSDLSVLRINQLTSMELIAPEKEGGQKQLELKSGAAYLFSREKPEEIQFRTPVASGAIRGTEFNLSVGEDGHTELALLDGEVDLGNDQGAVTLKSGEKAAVSQNQRPTKTAMVDAVSIIQWTLYYPAVVDPNELGFTKNETEALQDSLTAYRDGDLITALSRFPEQAPASDATKVYHAGLLLAVGQVEQALADLKSVNATNAPAEAVKTIIRVVKGKPLELPATPNTASESLARSYAEQSQSRLEDALKSAYAAKEKSPKFGPAWIRAAELEFGFGRSAKALELLDQGLYLSPYNAPGITLRGFLLSAQGNDNEALSSFNRAIITDGALAAAWLGRGLLKIRSGQVEAGREDLQIAATLEPNRAVLRSYLGKAFARAGDKVHAKKELDLAKKLDPNDPTAWLYSALLLQEEGRINQAASDLEKSKELNDNRSIFRSRLLLDQDQAVRSANLAAIYRDAGMFDVSVQEASAAVNADYLNSAAHQFLASSYDYIRDPKLINLRYETPAFSEYLMANLLSPAGGGLAQNISQQEYSRYFESDHLGLFSKTDYASNGDWVENASVYGVEGNTAFSLDGYYRTENGYRPNNDLDLWSIAGRIKQQVTEQDSIYLEVSAFESKSGDLAQYYSQSDASTTQRVHEEQEPSILFGYQHEWEPGVHTLIMGSRIQDTLSINDSDPNLLFYRTQVNLFTGATNVSMINPPFFSLDSVREQTTYSGEIQQVFETGENTLIVGLRGQSADVGTTSQLDRSLGGPTTITDQDLDSDFNRFSAYVYDYWQVLEQLQLTAGVAYDRMHYPLNVDTSPITSGEDTIGQVSPKVGVLWTPLKNTAFRGIYTRSLGGFSLDTSVRLEPTQIAGFNQAFRSLIPESVAGMVPGTSFETYGLGWNQKLGSGTYLVVDGQVLNSDATRTVGVLTNSNVFAPIADSPSSTRQTLDYEEQSFSATLNQLIGNDTSVGVRYRLTHADLESRFVQLNPSVPGVPNQDVSALLHQVWLYGIYNHSSGFFTSVDAIWSSQDNDGYGGTMPGDDFWQFNVWAGYRFWDRRAEARIGLLNVTDQDYQLNPLTLYNELPHDRTFVASLKINF